MTIERSFYELSWYQFNINSTLFKKKKKTRLSATMQVLTGSLLKKTREVWVKINHLFFQDVHPIPIKSKYDKKEDFEMKC